MNVIAFLSRRHHRADRYAPMCILAAILCLAAMQARGQAMDPDTLAGISHNALVSERPQIGKVSITVYGENDTRAEWTADYVQRRTREGTTIAYVFRKPDEVRNIGLLAKSLPGANRVWIYTPFTRRTRELDAQEADTRFLFSDLTYADIGMLKRRAASLRVFGAGAEQAPGDDYIVEMEPADSWQTSHIVTWLAAEDKLPRRKEFYDRAGRLWKKADYDVEAPHGIPTVVSIDMRDVQADTRSVLERTDIVYDVDIPAEVFMPENLWRLHEHAIWNGR